MAEVFLKLSRADQREALEFARSQSQRPSHLLEKDIWVVWALHALFDSSLANDLTFKGGTSLSKVYKIIDRFSEDIDLTYDIRELIPELMPQEALLGESGLPMDRSQANKWTKTIHKKLPDWIEQNIVPVIRQAAEEEQLDIQIEL